jgi:ribonuclease J
MLLLKFWLQKLETILMSNELTIQPLGGVGEIGSNCTLFETKSTKLFVDYGILFPYEDFFNISYLAADIDHLEATDKDVILFISHGHEDHIGAIFLFIKKFPQAKIYAPKFAELLIRKKVI